MSSTLWRIFLTVIYFVAIFNKIIPNPTVMNIIVGIIGFYFVVIYNIGGIFYHHIMYSEYWNKGKPFQIAVCYVTSFCYLITAWMGVWNK